MSGKSVLPTINPKFHSYLGVSPGYRHYVKRAKPGMPLILESVYLKWYSICKETESIPQEMEFMAKTHLETECLSAKGFGFGILHRCANDVYFLLLAMWRKDNELWETIWQLKGNSTTRFSPVPCEGDHKPIACVWELGLLNYEKQVWQRFLLSDKTPADLQSWSVDLYVGTV